MNFFDHKDLGNNLLQLCPKVVKHPVYIYIYISQNGKQYSVENPQTFCQTVTLFKVWVMVWCLQTEINRPHILHRNANIRASSHSNYELHLFVGSWWTRLLVSTSWGHATQITFDSTNVAWILWWLHYFPKMVASSVTSTKSTRLLSSWVFGRWCTDNNPHKSN